VAVKHDATLAGRLAAVPVQIVHLGNGGYLGLTSALGIQIDDTADGYGWYVGADPGNDAAYSRLLAPGELQATPGSQAFGRMDLLTVVLHEFGHILNLPDLDPHLYPNLLMTETLPTGIRRLPLLAGGQGSLSPDEVGVTKDAGLEQGPPTPQLPDVAFFQGVNQAARYLVKPQVALPTSIDPPGSINLAGDLSSQITLGGIRADRVQERPTISAAVSPGNGATESRRAKQRPSASEWLAAVDEFFSRISGRPFQSRHAR